MEFIFVVLIIIGLFSQVLRVAKEKDRQRARQFSASPDPHPAAEAPQPQAREGAGSILPPSGEGRSAAAPAVPRVAAAIVPEPARREPRAILRTPPMHREGESRAEHARHVERIRREEEELRRQQDELAELRNVNIEKLRSAVVMSEILDKPVSLRPRRF